MEFARRHIGPSPDEQGQMLSAVGYSSLDELTEAALPASASAAPLSLPPALTEADALAELRRLAGRNQVLTPMIGLGYYGTDHPGGDPPQRAGEPGLVHRLHAVPAGDLPGPAGGAAELPDDDRGPDRRCRVAGASLLDEATAAAEAMTLARRARRPGPRVPGRRRLPAADPGRAARPGPSRSASSWSSPTSPRR